MEWNENQQIYVETRNLHCPFYPFNQVGAGGMVIGDLMGDGKNEIAATWRTTLHR